MEKSVFEKNGIVEEEDVNSRSESNINPPSNESSCCCCWRPKSEFKPFVNNGLFSKIFRSDTPYNPCLGRINNEFFGKCSTKEEFKKAKEKLIQKYGKTKAEFIINWRMFFSSIVSSLGCGDCMYLNDHWFRERRWENLYQTESCNCCGRPLSELKPFTGGDPVMSNFLGKLLAKRFRPVDAPNDETKKILDAFYRRFSKYDEALEKLVQKYGAEEAAELWTFTFFKDGFFEVSWECSDCVFLDDHQYFEEKMAQDRTAGPLIQAKPMPA